MGIPSSKVTSAKSKGLHTKQGSLEVFRQLTGSTPARKPVPLSARHFETPRKQALVASALAHLPNATEAEYWLQKARALQQKGDSQGATEVLKGALSRDVRPATDIATALADMDKADNNVVADETPNAATGQPEGTRSRSKSYLWPSVRGVTATTPTAAPLPTPDTHGQHVEGGNRRESHVRFTTPEANVVAHTTSPLAEGANVRSAGSTPFRARPGESDEDNESDSAASNAGGIETPNTQMKRTVLPIIEEAITDMAQPDNGVAAAPTGQIAKLPQASRFLSESVMSPFSGAIHLLPGLPSTTQGYDELCAISPRSDDSARDDGMQLTAVASGTPSVRDGLLSPAANTDINITDPGTIGKQVLTGEQEFSFSAAVSRSYSKTPELAGKAIPFGVTVTKTAEKLANTPQALSIRRNVLFNTTPSTTSSSHADALTCTPLGILALPAPATNSDSAITASDQGDSEALPVEPFTSSDKESSQVEMSAPEAAAAKSDAELSHVDPSEEAASTGSRHDSPGARESAPDASFDSPSSRGAAKEESFMSPEMLGFTERNAAANKQLLLPKTPVSIFKGQAARHSSPLGRVQQQPPETREMPQTPKSAIRRPPRATEPASLSKPLRTPSSRPRPRVGRNELKSLMDSAAPADELQHMGSMASLSPMRTPAGLRETLGADKVVVTPVRRSARKLAAPAASTSSVLRQSQYSFVPNTALERRLGLEAIREPESFKDFALEDDDATSRRLAPIGTLQLERLAITDEPPTSRPEAASTPLPASREPTASKSTRKTGKALSSRMSKDNASAQSRRSTRSSGTSERPSMSPTEASIRESLRTATSKQT